MVVEQGPGIFESAGPIGLLAVLLGFVLLGTGVVAAVMRWPQRYALALFAVAWLPLPLGLLGRAAGDFAAQQEIILLGAAVTPKDMAYGQQMANAVVVCAATGLLLGLVGATAALARTRDA